MTTETTAAERACAFLPINERPHKPRSRGVTEIRGPYYAPVGKSYLADLLETTGAYVDTLKYAGGSTTSSRSRRTWPCSIGWQQPRAPTTQRHDRFLLPQTSSL